MAHLLAGALLLSGPCLFAQGEHPAPKAAGAPQSGSAEAGPSPNLEPAAPRRLRVF